MNGRMGSAARPNSTSFVVSDVARQHIGIRRRACGVSYSVRAMSAFMISLAPP